MTQSTNLDQFIAVTGETSSVLGKIVYFSLADVMIDREKLQEICDSMGIPYYGGGRQTDANAFRRATSDISDRIKADGHIYRSLTPWSAPTSITERQKCCLSSTGGAPEESILRP